MYMSPCCCCCCCCCCRPLRCCCQKVNAAASTLMSQDIAHPCCSHVLFIRFLCCFHLLSIHLTSRPACQMLHLRPSDLLSCHYDQKVSDFVSNVNLTILQCMNACTSVCVSNGWKNNRIVEEAGLGLKWVEERRHRRRLARERQHPALPLGVVLPVPLTQRAPASPHPGPPASTRPGRLHSMNPPPPSPPSMPAPRLCLCQSRLGGCGRGAAAVELRIPIDYSLPVQPEGLISEVSRRKGLPIGRHALGHCLVARRGAQHAQQAQHVAVAVLPEGEVVDTGPQGLVVPAAVPGSSTRQQYRGQRKRQRRLWLCL